MRSFALLAALVGSALASPFTMPNLKLRDAQDKGYSIATPKSGASGVTVTSKNTLNGTVDNSYAKLRKGSKMAAADPVKGDLDLALVNNFGGGAINAYIQGLDSNNATVFISANGSLIYPTAGGSATPVEISDPIAVPLGAQGETTNVNIPISVHSGRVYFAEGNLQFFIVSVDGGDGIVQPSVSDLDDPSAGLNWGFVELTYNEALEIWANISYVDFVGLIISMTLDNSDGSTLETIGLGPSAVTQVCDDLTTQANADGQPWNSMCIANDAGVVNRVISPGNYAAMDGSAFGDYWTEYIDNVWTQYASQPLTINGQSDVGTFTCQVNGEMLECDGDNRGYPKPVAGDIWGCNSGPFGTQEGDSGVHLAAVPRLCAAFTRTTLLLDGGDTTPKLDASNYYTVDPTNHYSRIVHEHEIDGRGYAFAYDDVNPEGNEDASGTVHSTDPQLLTLHVGGKAS